LPTLRSFFTIYTDGAALNETLEQPPSSEVFLGELPEVVVPSGDDELFGPHARAFAGFKPKRAFLLGMRREVKGAAGTFFDEARRLLLQATRGVHGVGLDVLRLWPFVLADAEELLADEILAEDLFSVGFSEMGEHGFRAETFGLAKLGQREISFEFRGRELIEEAALMCGHLADWLMDHGNRVEDAQSMAFGFDRLTFFAAEGPHAGGPFRGWHPTIIQRLLPESLFPGVGVLEVLSHPQGAPGHGRHDLTIPLTRSLEQRLLLEELDLHGDSPNAATTAQGRGAARALKDLVLWREERVGAKDSGWRYRTGDDGPEGVLTLGELARHVPDIVRFLALPRGARLEWSAEGRFTLDVSKARHDVEGDGPDERDD
jgi:hypothetical protein